MNQAHLEELSSQIEFIKGCPYWTKNRKPNVKKGDLAGYIDSRGYRMIGLKLNGSFQQISAHRLNWYINHRYLPELIDHIDRDKLNNDISNIRAVTKSQNSSNRSGHPKNISKYKGVFWNRHHKSWQAAIGYDGGKRKYLGIFSNRHDAARSYNLAARMYHGYEFAYTNIIEE